MTVFRDFLGARDVEGDNLGAPHLATTVHCFLTASCRGGTSCFREASPSKRHGLAW